MTPKTEYYSSGREYPFKVFNKIDTLAHAMTHPSSMWLTRFVRVFVLELKPGFWGQKDHICKEIIYRIAIFVTLLMSSPIVILGCIFGGSLRIVLSFLKKDFTYLEADCDAIGDTDKISVVSYNTLLMPEFITRRNMQRPSAVRVHEIADNLIKENSDIYCLQEVFHSKLATALAKKMQKAGYHVVCNISPHRLGLMSGLFLASKFPLKDIKFFPHPVKVGVDRFANKGVLIAVAEVGEREIMIANTHMNACGKRGKMRSYACRAIQVLKMSEHLDAYKGMPRIVCCDANIGPVKPTTKEVDPEWYIADRLHRLVKAGQVKLPSKRKLTDHRAWDSVVRVVDAIHRDVKETCGEKWQEGGPLPSEFHHDVDSRKSAMSGTTVDLKASPDVGWGDRVALKDERIDFVLHDDRFKRESLTIDMVVNKEGMLCSDHVAVRSTLSFT